MDRHLIRLSSHFTIIPSIRTMQFSLQKNCHHDERTLPSFSSMFPATTTSPTTSTITPMDASMTLGGMPPLNDVKIENLPTSNANITTTNANVTTTTATVLTPTANILTSCESSLEIVNAFSSLDAETDDTGMTKSVPLEFQCRYRRGKCSQPRTLKKNGSMHGYCEYHRQLSIRNQRVFDQKKRKRRQGEPDETKKQPPYPPRTRRQSVTSGVQIDQDEEKDESTKATTKLKRRCCRAS